MEVILASASPRRRELLGLLGVDFKVQVSGVEEVGTKKIPYEIVEELSFIKAKDVFDKTTGDVVVIGSDTIVAQGKRIMGKPKDPEDAKKMLRLLSGDVHQVYTGVTLFMRKEGREWSKTFHECTDVSFYTITRKELDDYIDGTDEWADKAGAYAVQGYVGAKFLKGMNGDYNNVVGLPVARLYQELKEEEILF